MSLNFWLNLLSAFICLITAIGLIRSWKQGLIRNWRARSLRKRLVPLIQSILGRLIEGQGDSVWQDLDFFRLREEVEELHRRSAPLSNEERIGLAAFLGAISTLHTKVTSDSADIKTEHEDVILKGQRIAQDMQEMGF